MKTRIMKMLIAAVCLTLGGAGCGQQNDKTGTPQSKAAPPPPQPQAAPPPKAQTPPPPKVETPPPRRPDAAQVERRERGDREQRGPRARWDDENHRNAQPPFGPQTPYIGVVTTDVPPPVASQLGLEVGAGVLVEEVMPDSPAQKSGVQRYDVITMLNDQRIVSADQLSQLVRRQRKGDETSLRILRRGHEMTVKVAVDERVMPPFEHPGMRRFEPWSGDRFNRWWSGEGMRERGQESQEALDQLHERMQRFQKEMLWQQEEFQRQMREFQEFFQRQMHERQERLRDRERSPQERPDPDKPRGESPSSRRDARPDARSDRQSVSVSVHAGGDGGTRVVSQGVVERQDATGTYLFERRPGGEMFFTARPRGGREQAWPVTTEEQRRAVPEPLRKRLDEMDDVRVDVSPGGPPPAAPAPKTGI